MIGGEISIQDYIETSIGNRAELSKDDLTRIWEGLVPAGTPGGEEGLEVFLESLKEPPVEGGEPVLHWRPGGWVFKVSEGVPKAALCGSLIAAAFTAVGFPIVGPAILGTLIPMLVNCERVKLKPSEKAVHLSLALQPRVLDHRQTPDQLYAELPQAIRDQVNRLDFADIISNLRKAGLVEEVAGGTIRVLTQDRSKFVVSFE